MRNYLDLILLNKNSIPHNIYKYFLQIYKLHVLDYKKYNEKIKKNNNSFIHLQNTINTDTINTDTINTDMNNISKSNIKSYLIIMNKIDELYNNKQNNLTNKLYLHQIDTNIIIKLLELVYNKIILYNKKKIKLKCNIEKNTSKTFTKSKMIDLIKKKFIIDYNFKNKIYNIIKYQKPNNNLNIIIDKIKKLNSIIHKNESLISKYKKYLNTKDSSTQTLSLLKIFLNNTHNDNNLFHKKLKKYYIILDKYTTLPEINNTKYIHTTNNSKIDDLKDISDYKYIDILGNEDIFNKIYKFKKIFINNSDKKYSNKIKILIRKFKKLKY